MDLDETQLASLADAKAKEIARQERETAEQRAIEEAEALQVRIAEQYERGFNLPGVITSPRGDKNLEIGESRLFSSEWVTVKTEEGVSLQVQLHQESGIFSFGDSTIMRVDGRYFDHGQHSYLWGDTRLAHDVNGVEVYSVVSEGAIRFVSKERLDAKEQPSIFIVNNGETVRVMPDTEEWNDIDTILTAFEEVRDALADKESVATS